MFGLEDKIIFVTGGNRGIGAAIVETLNHLGAKVAYTYRSEPGPDAALAIQADVTNPLVSLDIRHSWAGETMG